MNNTQRTICFRFQLFSFSAFQLFVALLLAHTATAVSIRWSAGTSDPLNLKTPRIYVTGPGSAQLSDIKAAVPKAPLAQVAPGVWHLRAELVVEEGARLVLYGTQLGGDVDELRLQSNNTGSPINDIIFLSADWGTLDIRSTKIISWDDAVNGPDTEYNVYKRSFVRIRSVLSTNGVTPLESRMDIIDSDVGYLGSHNAEAYGLVWKVLEAKNPADRPYGAITNLYSLVNVYGNVIRSRLHHNYFGHYSYGSYGQHIADNEVDHNVGYGLDPHDDSDYLIIERNNVHHNGWHGIIASQRCDHAIIRNNITWNNGKNGIMLHRYCNDSLIEGNRTFRNGDAGIALFDNSRTIVRNNVSLENTTAGIRLSVGPSDNQILNNEFAGCDSYGIYLYKGVDAPAPGDNGKPKRNLFRNNWIHDNRGHGVFSTTADDNTFTQNIFERNASLIHFVNGQRNLFESNSVPAGVTLRMQGLPNVLTSTIIRNQPALPIQVDNYSTANFEDTAGKIFDPEEPGIATVVSPAGSSLILSTVDIAKTSYVRTRAFRVRPNAGSVLVTPTVWNVNGDFSKRWLVQAGSGTASITYTVGDLEPGRPYTVTKNGAGSSFTADATGTITFHDTGVTTGLTEFVMALNL